MNGILGQGRAGKTLTAMAASRRAPSALLFVGPDGVGKKRAALEFAKDISCGDDAAQRGAVDRRLHPDIRLVDLEFQAGLLGEELKKQNVLRIETVREACKEVARAKVQGKWRVMVIDEAERLNAAAQNALLKFLEEPPPATTWVLVTSGPDRLLDTIRSRCQPVRFQALSPETVSGILRAEGFEPGEAAALAAACEGSVSRATSLRETRDLFREVDWGAPTAAFDAVGLLPKDLAQARVHTAGLIAYLASLVRRDLDAAEELLDLRRLLRRNVDPKLLLELAVLAAEPHAETVAASFSHG